MVGGYHIYRAVLQPGDECHLVGNASQGWVHFPLSCLLQTEFVQQQVVWRSLAGHPHASCFCLSYQADALFGGDVADMQSAAGLFAEAYVAFYLSPLALGADAFVSVLCSVESVVDVAAAQQTVHLAVFHYHASRSGTFFHGATHQRLALYAAAVVGEADHSWCKFLYINEFTLAFTVEGDTCVGMNANAAVACDNVLLLLEVLHAVWGRIGVRHGKYIGVAGSSSGSTSAQNGLFLSISGLSEMHMHIDERRYAYNSGRVVCPFAEVAAFC